MIKNKTIILLIFTVFGSANLAFSLSLDFIKRGFKHCTGTCDNAEMCPMEKDETFRWCLKNCAQKFSVKQICEEVLPFAMRPILPYETYAGPFATNSVTPLALDAVDRAFIEQTADRRRVVGTVKLLLLIREQLKTGKSVQIAAPDREKLADKIMKDYLKFAQEELRQYTVSGTIPDDKLAFMVKEIKSEIFAKIRSEK